MSSVEQIEELLEKYFEGETSLLEEKQLQDFFQGEDVPAHLESYKAQFNMSTLLSSQSSGLSETHLFSKIEEEAKVVKMPSSRYLWGNFYKVAAAAALLIIGYWSGNQLLNNKMSKVEEELAQMKTVMLEQLESNSASGRMQAVSNSLQFSNQDDETLDILIAVMKNDANMHVRTKAVEALSEIGNKTKVSQAFGEALLEEDEPAVQIALIEGLIQLEDKSGIEALEEITLKDNVLSDVKEEAHLGIFKLKEL